MSSRFKKIENENLTSADKREYTTKLGHSYTIVYNQNVSYWSLYTKNIEGEEVECLRFPNHLDSDSIRTTIEIFDLGVNYVKTDLKHQFEDCYNKLMYSKDERKSKKRGIAYEILNYNIEDVELEHEPYELK